MAKPETYKQAAARLLAGLKARGWRVETFSTRTMKPLKTPYAETPDGRMRLWFRAQSVHFTVGNSHDANSAHSLFADTKGISAEELERDAFRRRDIGEKMRDY